MKKIFQGLFVLAMLALLVAPGWYFYSHPEMLAVPDSLHGESGLAVNMPTPTMLAISPTPMLAIPPETPMLAVSSRVTIIVDTVNLRYSSGRASGLYLHNGDVVDVVWDAGNFGLIVKPKEFAGLLIWRGCTSDAGNLGCEAK